MKKKVLVVDDETDFIKVITIRLEANNSEVITASTGSQALEVLKHERPDAVLLDILMPEMDGLTALKKIREYDKLLPVFMITAFSNDENFESANKLNASGFIVKTRDLKKEVSNIMSAIQVAERYRGQPKE